MEIIPDSVMIGYVHMHTVFEGFARSLAEVCLNRDSNIYGIIASQNPTARSSTQRHHPKIHGRIQRRTTPISEPNGSCGSTPTKPLNTML